MKLEELKFKDFEMSSVERADSGSLVFEKDYPISGFKGQDFSSSEGTWVRSFVSTLVRTSPINVSNIRRELEVIFDFGENFIVMVGDTMLIGLIKLDDESFRMKVHKRPQK